jgi:transcription elongation factor GreA
MSNEKTVRICGRLNAHPGQPGALLNNGYVAEARHAASLMHMGRSGQGHRSSRVSHWTSKRIGIAIVFGMADTQRLSQAAYDRLVAEHKDLSTRGRIDIADKIEVARLMGDLKENGDYHAAKEEQGKMEGRISMLGGIIENSQIVGVADGATVQPGCVVEIRYEGDTDSEKLLFGSIEEQRDGLDICSPGSPLGLALEGAAPGSTISFAAPSGAELQVEIVSVEA